MSEIALLDLDHLARYTGGDEALEAELFALFVQQAENCLARLAETSDGDEWAAAAHTLKGAARGIGAMRLGEACAQAEARPLDPEAFAGVRETAKLTLQRIEEVMNARG